MTVNITKITSIGESISRSTALLGGDVRRSIQVDRIYRSQTIRQKTELLRIRENTYSKLSDGLRSNQGGSGGIGGIIEWLIGGEVLRRGGGGLLRKIRGGGGPKISGGGVGKNILKSGTSRFLAKAGLKRIPFVDIAFGALNYSERRGQGQTQGQAIGGAVAQTAGSVGGGLIGQALIPVPVLGYIIGSLIGSAVTTTIFDKVSGVDKLKSGADVRRMSEEDRLADKPSLFGKSLDKFDTTLDRFEDIVPTILKRKSLVSDLADDFPPELLTPPKPPNPKNPFGAAEVALDVLSIGLMILSLADNVIGLWGTEVPAAALMVARLRKYRRVLEFFGLMKKRHGKTYVRPEPNNKVVNPKKKKFFKRDEDSYPDLMEKLLERLKKGDSLDGDDVETLRRVMDGEFRYNDMNRANTRAEIERMLGLKKGITNQPDLKTTNQNQSLSNFGFKEGGEFEVDAPLSGAIVPIELHGKETVQVIPEGKDKGGNTTIIMISTKPRSPQIVTPRTSGSSGGGGVTVLQTPPFQTATKYFQMIGQLTT